MTYSSEIQLCESEGGLLLKGAGLSLRADFRPLLARVKPGRLQQELLVRAAKPKSLGPGAWVLDATAGLGEDSFLLAAAGLRVLMFERNPYIAALLQDALQRGMAESDLAPILGRMQLRQEDSLLALPKLQQTPDVLLLDPMFPQKGKSANSKKKMQLFQQLEGPCQQADELLAAALQAKPRKILVKRPLKGPYLAGVKPSYSLKGTTIRYDCILPASLSL